MAIKAATKLKATMTLTMNSATNLVASINQDESYVWAHNPQNLGKLVFLVKLSSNLSCVGREWNVNTLAVMKKKYSEARLLTELTEYLKLEKPTAELSDHVRQIIARSNL